MADKKQTDYRRVACELFERLIAVAWELDSLQMQVSAQTTTRAPAGSANFAMFSMFERHIVSARDLACMSLLDHKESLGREVDFPWSVPLCNIVLGGDDDEGET